MELYVTETSIHDIGLSVVPGIFIGQYNRRLECLCACLNAAKTWVDTFLSIPPAQYVAFSSSVYSNMARCFITIYRLTTFENPEWDRRIVRESLNISLFLDKAEQNFARVAEAAGLDVGGLEDPDFFTLMASKLRILKTTCDVAAGFIMASYNTPLADGVGDFSMEALDDDWLRDLLGPWNEPWS